MARQPGPGVQSPKFRLSLHLSIRNTYKPLVLWSDRQTRQKSSHHRSHALDNIPDNPQPLWPPLSPNSLQSACLGLSPRGLLTNKAKNNDKATHEGLRKSNISQCIILTLGFYDNDICDICGELTEREMWTIDLHFVSESVMRTVPSSFSNKTKYFGSVCTTK